MTGSEGAGLVGSAGRGDGERRIVRLDEAVANQIAAGEVVERPASVVKELVENALDADARRIVVELEAGGEALVRVTDDGCGMGAADAVACLERHATSKLRTAADLETVRTLGFRGEAIPSIASVSRFTLTTRARGDSVGTRVQVEGGRLASVQDAGAAPGTVIEVRDLFFNVPARKKFLKRAQTESGHVTEALTRLALARPDVHVRLTHDGRESLDVPASTGGDLRGRLGRILGHEVAEQLFPIQEEPRGGVEVRGFISSPSLSERTPRGLYVFVNGRYVRDRTISHAIQDAYRTLLEKGRYPTVVLFVELDPRGLDVNVHPQKVEVRFADTGQLHRAVSGALGRTLLAQPWLRSTAPSEPARRYALRPVAEPAPGPPPPELAASPPTLARSAAPEPLAPRSASRPAASIPHFGQGKGISRFLDGLTPPSLGGRLGLSPRPGGSAREALVEPDPTTGEGAAAPHPATEAWDAAFGGRFGALEPIGQALGTYLVCQGVGELVLIDQHAAHERIAFERLRRERRERGVVTQPLLLPLMVELDAARSARAHDAVERLLEVGIELEPFGGNTWAVKAAPVALKQAALGPLVVELLDALDALDATTPLEEVFERLMACAACHSVVRAGDRLTIPEMKALLRQMDEADLGAHCPHGRPVFVRFGATELARLFHRT
jgi:DNA mismatch repair protein MutL